MVEIEVARIYERYAVEVVERFGFCPWAAPARRAGQVRMRVILSEISENLADSLAALDALADDESVVVGLLLYPISTLGRRDFERFVGRLAREDAQRRQVGQTPFAMAAFHPDAEPALDDSERLVPFLRRTPDPTVQLVRNRALEEVRRGDPPETSLAELGMLATTWQGPQRAPLRQRVLEHGRNAVAEAGLPAIEAIFEDIQRDRARSYARLGLL